MLTLTVVIWLVIGRFKFIVCQGKYTLLYFSVDLEVPMGQDIMSRLTLPCDITRVVRLFSSHSSIISFPEHYNKEFTLVPGKLNLIEYHVRSA